MNLAFIKRIEVTSRRVFEERWLRDRGKVDVLRHDQARLTNLLLKEFVHGGARR